MRAGGITAEFDAIGQVIGGAARACGWNHSDIVKPPKSKGEQLVRAGGTQSACGVR